MMRVFWMLLLLSFSLGLVAQTEAVVEQEEAVEELIMVLKNKKQYRVLAYEVKGDFVVMTNTSGSLVQLPLKVVDLEASKAATAALRQREKEIREAEIAAKEESKRRKQVRREQSMGEIAEIIQGNRDPKKGEVQSFSIDDETVDTFGENNPRTVQSQAANNFDSTGRTPADYQQKFNEIGGRYHALQTEINQLKANIDQQEIRVGQLEENAAFTDAVVGAQFETFEKAEQELEKMRTTLAEKEKELKSVALEGKRNNVNVKRYKPKKDGDN